MYELNKNQFHLVLPLLNDIQNRAVYSLSVIEQIQRGRIFVNDEQNPTAVFITSSGGFYCLAGQAKDEHFNKSVVLYINDLSDYT